MLSLTLPATNFLLGRDDLSSAPGFDSRVDSSWTVSRSTVLLWAELEGGSGWGLVLLVGVVSSRVGVASLANVVGGCGETGRDLDKPVSVLVKPVVSPPFSDLLDDISIFGPPVKFTSTGTLCCRLPLPPLKLHLLPPPSFESDVDFELSFDPSGVANMLSLLVLIPISRLFLIKFASPLLPPILKGLGGGVELAVGVVRAGVGVVWPLAPPMVESSWKTSSGSDSPSEL